MTPPKSAPDDPFGNWDGPAGNNAGAGEEPGKMPDATVDPNRLPWIISAFRGQPNVKRQGTLELVSSIGPSKFSDVTLVVKFNDKQYHLGLQTFDRSYVALRQKFGPDRENWHGKLYYKVMAHKGNPVGFVAVLPA